MNKERGEEKLPHKLSKRDLGNSAEANPADTDPALYPSQSCNQLNSIV